MSPLTVLQLANDLRQDLAAMVRRIDVIRSRVSTGQNADREFESLDSAIDGGFDVARELIAFANRNGHTGLVDLNELITQNHGVIQRILGDGIRLHLDLTPLAPVARGDQSRFEWVLLNLVLKARDEMSGRGVLTISTASVDRQSLPARIPDGRWVRLGVTDTGPAMHRDGRERPVELSFPVKAENYGNGSRLSDASTVVRELGGWLRSQSVEPFGTHIDIYLPAAGPKPLTR